MVDSTGDVAALNGLLGRLQAMRNNATNAEEIALLDQFIADVQARIAWLESH